MLIVGDGLAGRVLAIALADTGHRVALLDRRESQDEPPAANVLDQRCTALSAGTVDWLAARQLWHPEAAAAAQIRRVQVSQSGHFGAVRINGSEIGRDALGWTIENRCFTASLRDRLDSTSVVKYRGRVVQSVNTSEQEITVALAESGAAGGSKYATAGAATPTIDSASDDQDKQEHIRARLLIIADGARSDTARILGIGSTVTAHDQYASLTTAEMDRDHRGTARERFTAGGPLAVLPRPGRTVSIVACHTPEEASAVASLDDEGFAAWLAARMPSRAGRVVAVGPRMHIPLERIEASQQHAPRVALVGNALRLLHPVAGQGYNLAIRDMATLVDTLDGAADPGDATLLSDWVSQRRHDQRSTVALTDALARVFRGQSRSLGHARALGLIALDLVAPARRQFARVTTRGHLSPVRRLP